ncbi:MutT/NUDIX family protein [Streptococcus sanguinis SK72]|uniref:MutT/NUDIX family protein n=1 Tax=Streptococcus sanguinis SK72 TaxID=888809 RepID=F0I058_STRSA|nr:NUDIX hydrolase N-terminal domain-containing protein [Streptococcus sanguinis]EGD30276.1 MutT/NUDIX family protein [Streptococcus sanguinis SK72]
METKEIAKTIQRLLSITETGLAFSRDEFDRERYLELRQLLGHLLADWSDLDGKELAELLCPTYFYATPLIDVRVLLVRDGKVCLVKGKNEKTWALPGGFCEVGLSPKENIVKEVQEETGFNVSVSRLLAIFDTNKFQFQSKQYAKLVFECQIEDGDFQPNTEIEELAFFDIQSLPELSSKRTTKEQLEILWEIYQGDREQYVD